MPSVKKTDHKTGITTLLFSTSPPIECRETGPTSHMIDWHLTNQANQAVSNTLSCAENLSLTFTHRNHFNSRSQIFFICADQFNNKFYVVFLLYSTNIRQAIHAAPSYLVNTCMQRQLYLLFPSQFHSVNENKYLQPVIMSLGQYQ